MGTLDESDALCLVCQGCLVSPVHVVCQKACGVKMCSGCWDQFAQAAEGRPRCPLCKALVFPDLTGKDHAFRCLLSRCRRPCGNPGCTVESMLHDEMVEHEGRCDHRIVACPHCALSLKAMELPLHECVCDRVACGAMRVSHDFKGALKKMGVRGGCSYRGTMEEVERHKHICAFWRFEGHLDALVAKVGAHARECEEREAVLRVAMDWD
jgi:hypothetical protein